MRTDIRPAPTPRPTDHLLVARRDGRAVGVIAAELTADGLAEVRPPVADDPDTADALAVALLDRLRAAGVVVAQCLLSADETSASLVRAGFRHVTQLTTLVRPAGPAHAGRSPLSVQPADGPELVATFVETLVGSLDLPELTGLRPPAVELAGYPATHHLLARREDQPVGLLLLAAGEVLYLGVVPAFRGRGFGAALLRHALTTLSADATAVTVSADARNRPAIRLYEGHRFRPCRSQEVFLWTAAE